ncbi:MAG: tRNA (N6-threonylcarbamoyladenosine(37)-N6)-methyltransferase TrmO [Clostridia bacterium]|nr:tRNA (N6-threonylcarbamoyladenosine(37)-N6)-methyltransferase TrmO [Clostridia bacterium]
MIPIAHVENDFPEKFGLPRQPGILCEIPARIVFEPAFRDKNALRGLEGFERLWLLWQFDRVGSSAFSPTVRPPKLGGNTRVGVFATRSPNRPNPIGLTCVRLDGIDWDEPALIVRGADMKSGTAILDIKPYLPYADAYPDAKAGFTEAIGNARLTVRDPDSLLFSIPPEKRGVLESVLSGDPRPGYQREAAEYGIAYAGFNIRFSIDGETLTITQIKSIGPKEAKRHDE